MLQNKRATPLQRKRSTSNVANGRQSEKVNSSNTGPSIKITAASFRTQTPIGPNKNDLHKPLIRIDAKNHDEEDATL
jgi:hypothetical protein